MTVLVSNNPTLLDLTKRLDPNGNIAKIVELLAQTNEVLDDASYVESNQPTSHLTTVRTGIPQPTWRKLYGGVQPTKSTTVQVVDNVGNLENYAEVDSFLVNINGNAAAFRLSEDRPILEGINQELAGTIFYGNEGTDPAEFTGLAPRFNDGAAANGQNILHAGGTGTDNTSIWLVCWSPETVHMLYPKGMEAGVSSKDLGEVTIENADGAGGRMQAFRTHYKVSAGLSVRDWRYVVRIPNIDMSDLKGVTGTQALTASTNVLYLMASALERIQSTTMGRCAFYMHRQVREKLRRMLIDKVQNSSLTMDEVAGKRVLTFDGVPIRRVDQLSLAEAVVPNAVTP